MGNQSLRQSRHALALRRVLLVMAAVLIGFIVAANSAGAQDPTGTVDVIEANGLIDPVLADFIERSMDDAEANGSLAIVLQMESDGAAIDDDRLDELVERIESSAIPVSVWLGPAGNGRANNRASRLALASERIGISPGSELELASGARIGYDELIAGNVPADFSIEVQDAPALLNHLLELPEFQFEIYQPGDLLPNGATVGDEPTRLPITRTRFITLPLIDQQFHTFASPAVAYLLFVIGLGLLVFELYTAGVGVAGMVGAGTFLAGSYGLAVLDARPIAVGLLVVAFIAFAVDVQSGIQQFWSAIGSLFLVVGSLILFREHSIGWLPLSVGIVGVLLAMLGGMPAMVRTRFSTPTIGREWMIGSAGDVVEAIDPEGVISIDGAPWRARTNRATPIEAGERARVVEVDGLLLEVEPEEGAAIDYRERRRSTS